MLVMPWSTLPLIFFQMDGRAPFSRVALELKVRRSFRLLHSAGRDPVRVLLPKLTLLSFVLLAQEAGTVPEPEKAT